jgi:hypothetical protein
MVKVTCIISDMSHENRYRTGTYFSVMRATNFRHLVLYVLEGNGMEKLGVMSDPFYLHRLVWRDDVAGIRAALDQDRSDLEVMEPSRYGSS